MSFHRLLDSYSAWINFRSSFLKGSHTMQWLNCYPVLVKKAMEWIARDHFWVAFCLCIKTSLWEKPFNHCSDCRFIFVQIKLFFIWKVCRKTRFETLRHKVTRKWPIWPVDKSQSFIRSLPSSLPAVRKQTALDSSDCKSGNMECPVELHMHIGQTHTYLFFSVFYICSMLLFLQ